MNIMGFLLFLYHDEFTKNDLIVFNIFQASLGESDMGNFADLCIAHSSKSRFRTLTINSTESGCISDVLARDLIHAFPQQIMLN